MFNTLHLKTLNYFQSSSPSSSSTLSTAKLKSLIRTIIVSHMCRLYRALSKFKTTIVNILMDDYTHNYNTTPQFPKKHCSNNTTTQKVIFGSFRLHYNWCSSKSSHVLPVPTRVYQGMPPSTGNSTGNSSNFLNYKQQGGGGGGGEDYLAESELAGYLQWLEEKVDDDDEKEMNEIDMLAEIFIANSHEKFKLEKQESDRRFHEMLARGL